MVVPLRQRTYPVACSCGIPITKVLRLLARRVYFHSQFHTSRRWLGIKKLLLTWRRRLRPYRTSPRNKSCCFARRGAPPALKPCVAAPSPTLTRGRYTRLPGPPYSFDGSLAF
ncbi:hypothetical protein BC567DRAFT_43409 [Phyllosticta citribraziliensis]